MKKLLFILVAIILTSTLIITGCAKKEIATPTPTPTKTATATPATTPTKTVTPTPTPSPTPTKKPAAFTLSNLSIQPAEIDPKGVVTISVVVSNTGESKGDFDLIVMVNNVTIAAKVVTLDGGAKQTVSYTYTGSTAGTNTVKANNLSGTFTVKAPPPPTGAPTAISWKDAKNYIGQNASVTGPIIDSSPYQDLTLLGMGKGIMETGSVGIEIKTADLGKYDKDLYKGKTITVTGELVSNPSGGASIQVTDPSQIVVVG